MKILNNKFVKIGFFLVLIVVSCLLIYKKFDKVDTNKDANKFAQEYRMVGSDNSFQYKTSEEIIKILENGTGIVFLGFPECNWCQYYVKYIDEVAKETDNKVNYYNVKQDREENNETYKKLISLLTGKLQFDKDGNERIYVPHVAVVIKGEIVEFDYESSLDTAGLKDPALYWTEEKKTNLKSKLKPAFEKVFSELNSCTSCDE